jgi:hypothetical protein
MNCSLLLKVLLPSGIVGRNLLYPTAATNNHHTENESEIVPGAIVMNLEYTDIFLKQGHPKSNKGDKTVL